MNLGEIRSEARSLLDDTAVPYLWSDENLLLYINKAVDEAAIRAQLIRDSYTSDCCDIFVSPGVADYALHESVFYVDRVLDATNQQPLTNADFHTMDAANRYWRDDAGNPTHYLADFNHYGKSDGRTITLYPKPEAACALKLTVLRTPLAPLVNDADIPEIPYRYHVDLLDWVLHLAYKKNDADTLNPNKSAEYEAAFEKNFGRRPSALWLELSRKQKTLRTRGVFK